MEEEMLLAIESRITSMSREELETTAVKCLKKLHEGVDVVQGQIESIEWLARTGLLLAQALKGECPALEKETDMLVEQIKRVSGIEQ